MTHCVFSDFTLSLTRCNFFNFKRDTISNFEFKICYILGLFRAWLNYYQSATNIKEQLSGKRQPLGVHFFYECVACVCLTFGTIFLLIAILMANGVLMAVTTISFGLPIDLYKCHWISEKSCLQKLFILLLASSSSSFSSYFSSSFSSSSSSSSSSSCFSSNNSSLRETKPAPRIDDKSPLRNKN